MKIQIDIPEDLNKKLKFYKDIEGLGTLQEAVIKLIRDYFKIMNAKLKERIVFDD
jgi:hypothetical protein